MWQCVWRKTVARTEEPGDARNRMTEFTRRAQSTECLLQAIAYNRCSPSPINQPTPPHPHAHTTARWTESDRPCVNKRSHICPISTHPTATQCVQLTGNVGLEFFGTQLFMRWSNRWWAVGWIDTTTTTQQRNSNNNDEDDDKTGKKETERDSDGVG